MLSDRIVSERVARYWKASGDPAGLVSVADARVESPIGGSATAAAAVALATRPETSTHIKTTKAPAHARERRRNMVLPGRRNGDLAKQRWPHGPTFVKAEIFPHRRAGSARALRHARARHTKDAVTAHPASRSRPCRPSPTGRRTRPPARKRRRRCTRPDRCDSSRPAERPT